MYRKFFKRLFDIVCALALLLFLWPLIIVIALILSFVNKGSPFFFQERPGLSGKPFILFKFKTMRNAGGGLTDMERLTKAGRFLRRFSLDELPQLLNVLTGTMSLVGPRPLLMQYLPLYNDFQKKRHLVRPGITGWAQVNGRNLTPWPERFAMDVYYAEKLSFLLDLRILLMTLGRIFSSGGINHSSTDIMPEFKGNHS